MTRLRLFIATACLILLPASAAAGDGPALRPHAIVDGALVTLGDLFDNAGAASEKAVFRAPDPGDVGNVSAARVGEAARRHGLDWQGDGGITTVTVTRTSTEVPLDAIKEVVAAAARSRLGLPDDARLAVDLDPRARPLHLPSKAAATIDVARLDLNRDTGAFAAEIRASDPAAGGGATIYRGRAVETISLPVLTAPIVRGERIGDGDIVMRLVPRNSVMPGTIVHREEVAGMAARRSLNPGETLRDADIEAPKLVTRNATVKLVYKSTAMTISTLGRALDDGARGESVRILNVRSKRIIDATVTGTNTVSVSPTAAAKTALLESTD